ncbi:uncharacterized protein PRCAT00004694001 [Priceomyces carsonii]|uniref:uncharacterized protein n=1 Tax=Priceomyces carsonii TaxID=28549 RepID=UPI002EDAFAE9|nr:unnamed protein product [Priceomyces carsonii]
MTSQPSVTNRVDPFVDRIISNPLSFKPAKQPESDQAENLKGFIRLNKNSAKISNSSDTGALNTKEHNLLISKEEDMKPRPRSMAEAVAAYTGKKFLSKREREVGRNERKEHLLDSDLELQNEEDFGESEDDLSVKSESDSFSDSNYESASEYPVERTEPIKNQVKDESPSPGLDSEDEDDDDFDDDDSDSSESDSVASYSSSDSKISDDSENLKIQLKEEAKVPLAKKPVDEIKQSISSEKEESTPPTSPEDESRKVPEKSTECTYTAPLSLFYMINEVNNDRGSNESKRIYKSWREFSKRKPVGLLNNGVTCYMNSAIQSLIHIPALQHYLNDINAGKYDKTLKTRSVSHILAELSRRMWGLDDGKNKNKPSKYVNPKRIIQRLGDINCMMSEWQQEDSHEYLMSLMSRLQEDSTPKGVKLNQSILYDIFGGLLNQKVTCSNCSNVSETKQEFYDLSLGLNKRRSSGSNRYSIEKSMDDFFSSEVIKPERSERNSGYFCETCEKNTTAAKISTIDRSPETLIVHLKRFKFDGNSSSKLKQSISYSNHLDLSKYTTKNEPTMYKLISVIVHEGRSLSSGHYISHCLQPDGTWSTYDDEYINKINEREALTDPSAYVLVYTKLTPKFSEDRKRAYSTEASIQASKKKKRE